MYWSYEERSPINIGLNAAESVKEETQESEEYPVQSALPEGAVQATEKGELTEGEPVEAVVDD